MKMGDENTKSVLEAERLEAKAMYEAADFILKRRDEENMKLVEEVGELLELEYEGKVKDRLLRVERLRDYFKGYV